MNTIRENYVGIDYHTAHLQVCIMDSTGKVLANRRCKNDVAEVEGLIRRFGEPVRVCAEASAGSVEFLEQLSQVTGWQKRLCHPGYVNRMKHNPDKSDKSDCELIADLDRSNYLPQVWFPPLEIRDLRKLVRYRQDVLDQRKQAKLRIRSLLRDFRIPTPPKSSLWTRVGLQWLRSFDELPSFSTLVLQRLIECYLFADKELKFVEKQLKEYCARDRLATYLLKLRGIGLVTASTMRAEIADFLRFKNGKELSRFCGVSPRNASSGQRQADAGLIRAGSPLLKTAVIETDHRLIHCDKKWKAFAQRHFEAGKPYPVVTAAVANRWLRKLYWQVREEFYSEKTKTNLCGSAELESLLG